MALTPAQAHLAKVQRRFPPLYPRIDGLDRVQQLYRALAPGLPPALQHMVTVGAVAIGEVGRHVPDARTINVAPGAMVVEMTSGMMDFQYAVGRALSGLDVGNARLPELQTVAGIATQLARVFRSWKRYITWAPLWPWRRRVERPSFAVTREAIGSAEMMVTIGEMFILAHELGHVALNTRLVNAISGNDEGDADRYGLQFFLAATKQHWHPRMAYAGPIIPIRNLAALERAGVTFSDRYPPQLERLRILFEEIRKVCPSPQYLHEASTILVAYQDMLDDIDKHIHPLIRQEPPDWERILVRLLAQLQEVGQGRVAMSQYINDISLVLRGLDASVVRKATDQLVAYYVQLPPVEPGLLSPHVRISMTDALIRLLRELPPNLKPLFPSMPPAQDAVKR